MPALANQRHEIFAHSLVGGTSATEAYVAAGYKANDGNAARLKGDDRIRDRVVELQLRVVERTIEKTAIDRQWVIEQLVANSASAQQAGKFEASTSALKLIGQELFGMFIDRKEVKSVDAFASMSDAELDQYLANAMVGPRR